MYGERSMTSLDLLPESLEIMMILENPKRLSLLSGKGILGAVLSLGFGNLVSGAAGRLKTVI